MTNRIIVIYASMSGNSEFLAENAAEMFKERGVEVESEPRHMDSVALEDLAEMPAALFVVPTWGQGEVPADAEPLFEALQAADTARLKELRFGLIAPGDRSYPDFCGGGRLFAEALVRCGAQQIAEPLFLDGIPMERHVQSVGAHLTKLVSRLGL